MADLYQQRQMIFGAIRNLLLQAETRSLTWEQMAAFDRLYADLNNIDSRLRAVDSRREMFGVSTPVTAAPAVTYPASIIAAGSITSAQITAPVPCPCGYTEECHIWCGDGHETGECTDHSHRFPALGIAGRKRRKADDYDHYRELYATTGDEEAFDKMLDCVTIE